MVSKSEHYNCPAMRIASMPGGDTTIGDVHDAIEKQLQLARIEAKIEAAKHVLLKCKVRVYPFGEEGGYVEEISYNEIMKYVKDLTAQKAHLTTKEGVQTVPPPTKVCDCIHGDGACEEHDDTKGGDHE